MNYNVTLTFVLRISFGVAYGMWSMAVLSAYIYILGGDSSEANEMVGYAQAIEGTFVAAAALPMGWLASKVRRDRILKFSGVVSVVAIVATVAAVTSTASQLHKYYLLCLALAFWGITEAASPILDSLFADSVPTGQRSGLYTTMFVCTVVTQGLGPLLASIYFYFQGNTWTLASLQSIMLAGMAVSAIPTVVLFLFDDTKALGAESEGLLKHLHPPPTNPSTDPLSKPLLADHDPSSPHSEAHPADGVDDDYFYNEDDMAGDEASPSATASPMAHDASPLAATRQNGGVHGEGCPSAGHGGVGAGAGFYQPPAFVLPSGYHKFGSSGELRVSPQRYLEAVQEDDGPLYPHEGVCGGGYKEGYEGAYPGGYQGGHQGGCRRDFEALKAAVAHAHMGAVQEHVAPPACRPIAPPAMLSIPPGKSTDEIIMIDPTTGAPVATAATGTVTTPPGARLATGLSSDSSPEGTATPALFQPPLALQSPEGLALISPALDSPNASPPDPKDPYAATRALWCIQPTCDPSPTPLPRPTDPTTTVGAGAHSTITIPPTFPPATLNAPPPGGDASSTSSGNPSPPSPYTHQLLRTPPAYINRPRYLLPSRSMDSLMLAHTPRPISIPPTSSESDQPTPSKPPPSFTSTPNSSFGTPVNWDEQFGTPPSYRARVATWVSNFSHAPSACLSVRAIPAVLAVSDCISGLASGMTVKFFPIFFKEAVRLPPTSVSLIFAVTPLALSLLSLASRALSTRLGRIQTMLLFRLTGIALISAIALYPALWALPAAVVPMFMVRTAAMNCCYPLQKSVLMDFVPKETRARWNSLEALTAFGWSGSAAAGGLLLTRYGFATTFTITAAMQLMSWSLLWLLLPLVPRDESLVAALVTQRAAEDAAFDVRRASQEQQHQLDVEAQLRQLQQERGECDEPQVKEEEEAAVRLNVGAAQEPTEDSAPVAPQQQEQGQGEGSEPCTRQPSDALGWRGVLGLRRTRSEVQQPLLQAVGAV